MLAADACTSFRFSTDRLPEAARAKAVSELYERTRLPGKIEPLEPLPDCPLRVDITKLSLPGLGIMSGTLAGLRQAARPRGVAGGEDDLLLAVNLRGRSSAQQGTREVMLRDGDAMLATRGLTGFTITRRRRRASWGFACRAPPLRRWSAGSTMRRSGSFRTAAKF